MTTRLLWTGLFLDTLARNALDFACGALDSAFAVMPFGFLVPMTTGEMPSETLRHLINPTTKE